MVSIHPFDAVFNSMSGFMEKVSKWIPEVNIPFDKFYENWGTIGKYLNQANKIFPVDTLLTIIGIVFAFMMAMLVLWIIKFLKSFIPFF